MVQLHYDSNLLISHGTLAMHEYTETLHGYLASPSSYGLM